MPQQISAAEIRKILNEKFPPTNQREKVYVSVTLALLDSQEEIEAQVRGLAELLGLLCTALEIDPRQLLAMKSGAQTTIEGDEAGGGSSGTAGMGGAGAGVSGGGGVSAGATGGGGAGPANPIADKTPFPAGVAASAPPGTKPPVRVTQQPGAKPYGTTGTVPAAVTEEDLTPNAQSGPAVNARPNVVPPPANGAPKVQ